MVDVAESMINQHLRSECIKHALGCYNPDSGCDPESVLRIAQYFYDWCETGKAGAVPLLRKL